MHLILYDGLCGLCDRFNRFVLARDQAGRFQFASLQSDLGRSIVERFGADPDHLTTVLVVSDFMSETPKLRNQADAALFIFEQLGGPWHAARLLRVFPRGVLDWGYDLIARNRYRVFGRYEACPLPDRRFKARFLDE